MKTSCVTDRYISILNRLAEVVKWKRTDVLEYIKSKQNDLDLDDEDIKIIEKNKVAGQVFINLTEEKLLAPPYNLLGGPAGAIAFLIKSLKDEVQASYISYLAVASTNELEKSEESFQEKNDLQTDEAIEKTCINEPSCNLISASGEILVGPYLPETDDLIRNTEATEKTCTNEHPISTSNFLPETASQLLRYYDVWNRPHKEWPSLSEFSDHLYKVHNISKKDLVHSSFKIEIGILQKLFAKQHPAQSRLSELANMGKLAVSEGIIVSDYALVGRNLVARCVLFQQTPRLIKKVRRAKVTEKSTKQKVLKQKIELAKDSVILNGFHRINQHYDDYHEASSDLIKRNLDNGDSHDEKVKRFRK
ncbi:6022_t:CDS:2 [Funneliformis caledonium]|uniref:6022_t:CDS:1 n=1 Tax=Funneliformis caledonium TaxID=1117310 RepID=A0A9N9CWY0_9GLOM|nr:6022_t:CDS:2 [Funneliformis caledonium]